MQRFTTAEIDRLKLLACCGYGGNAIATSLGRTPQAIRVKCVELGIRLRKRRPGRIIRCSLAQETADRLQVAAIEKGTTPTRLMRQVIDTVVRDNLFAAVIDAPPLLNQKDRLAAVSPKSDQVCIHKLS